MVAGLLAAFPHLVVFAAEGAPASRPHVYLGDVRADTIQATPREIRPAAQRALESDHWVVASSSTSARVVTEWKEFRHPLARLLLGNIRARCVVDIQPLDERLTIVRFQGGLASADDVQDKPAFSVAQSQYRDAVANFYRDLVEGIAVARNAEPVAREALRTP